MTYRWIDAGGFADIAVRVPGSYVLVVRLDEGVSFTAGALQELEYRRGWYAYCGSALKGLKQRLSRYLDPERKRYWHIDYLLEHGVIEGAWTLEGGRRLECAVAGVLAERLGDVPGFGATDCRCRSHLFYTPARESLEKALTRIRE